MYKSCCITRLSGLQGAIGLLSASLVVASFWVVQSAPGIVQEQVPSKPQAIQEKTGNDRDSDRTEVERLLESQADCWNAGDIEGFMETYWKSEEMSFSSGGQLVRGWQGALDRYRRNYPRESMGQLAFDVVEFQLLGETSAMLLGNFHLKNGDRTTDGNFTLVLRKFPEGWRIIHDHSSAINDTEELPAPRPSDANPNKSGGE